jgi:hypothetical protein
MPQTFTNGFDLPYRWSQTALAVWHKYPNPFAPHVISMDVIDRTYNENTGLLRIERVLGVSQGAPGWAVKVSSIRLVWWERSLGVYLQGQKKQFLGEGTHALPKSGVAVCWV